MEITKKLILKTPLRVTWKISKDTNLIQKIVQELINSKIFFLKLDIGNIKKNEEVKEAIEILNKHAVRVSINMDLSIIDTILRYEYLKLKFDRFIIEIQSSKDLLKNKKKITFLSSQSEVPKAISLSLNNNNIDEISVIVDEIRQLGIKEIILENTDIIGKKNTNKNKYTFNKEKWSDFKKTINKYHYDWNKDLNFIVHDYFIWKEFNSNLTGIQTTKGEYNGCQAGNVLAYIASNGDVYPCASMPLKIGSLKKSTFQELWALEDRKELYNAINKDVELCTNCVFVDCKGGCRGMVYFLNNSFNYQDRLCPFNMQEQ
ncbi:SPASM domain-containing protein [Candidatus Poribacteria bacterium]|nr:SPASM domain-containing protein [Candidatus Poribacteria bacterium]